MNTQLVVGSLAAISKRDNLSLAESFMSVDVLLVVDMSGSMCCQDARGNRERYEVAEDELRQIQAQMPGKVGIVAFSDRAEFCPSGVPTHLFGGTDMAGALRFVKPADGTGIRIILISDGQPNNEAETLAVARTFESKLDTIYIGPETSLSGPDFLRRLAAATGGQAAKSAGIAELTAPVMKLLAAG